MSYVKRYEDIKCFEDMAVDIMEQQISARLICYKEENRWVLVYL